MATTVSAATLTVTLTESITLNGLDFGEENTLTVASIVEVSSRIVNVDTSASRTLLSFSSAIGTGQYIVGNVKYIRITNLDDTNYAEIIIAREDGSDGLGTTYPGAILKLEAAKSVMLGLPDGAFGASADGSSVAAGDLGDIVSISAKANTAAVDLQVFTAST